ncbi:hypothetical protein [Salmonella enterica]|uniref:hypothetical protein n=1 Tax=Salmonella enterica TaxID=28901 RepID=UPI00316540A0
MSATAAWTYTNVCTVYPLDSTDSWSNKKSYGAPYLINATWGSSSTVREGDTGSESAFQNVIYTECKYDGESRRIPLKGDFIALGDTSAESNPVTAGAVPVFTVESDDMSFFGEDPDYEISTIRKWQGS